MKSENNWKYRVMYKLRALPSVKHNMRFWFSDNESSHRFNQCNGSVTKRSTDLYEIGSNLHGGLCQVKIDQHDMANFLKKKDAK